VTVGLTRWDPGPERPGTPVLFRFGTDFVAMVPSTPVMGASARGTGCGASIQPAVVGRRAGRGARAKPTHLPDEDVGDHVREGHNMRRYIATAAAAALAAGMLAAPAAAHHTAGLTFSANPAPSGTTVTVTATADGAQEQGTPRLRLDICDTVDDGAWTGVYQPAANCVAAVDGAAWREVGDLLAPAGSVTQLPHQFDTSTTEVVAVGFRARYSPQDGSDNHPNATATADLNITYSQTEPGETHPGCKGVENAYEQVTTKGNGKANAANALSKVAEKLGCDISE
jgi:hypothetical protein